MLYEDGLGIRYEMRLLALTDNGQVTVDDSGIRISAAGSVTLLIAAATNFEGFDRSPGSGGTDPSGICRRDFRTPCGMGLNNCAHGTSRIIKPYSDAWSFS